MSTVNICFAWEYDDSYEPLVVDPAFIAKIMEEEKYRLEAEEDEWLEEAR